MHDIVTQRLNQFLVEKKNLSGTIIPNSCVAIDCILSGDFKCAISK